MEAPVNQDPTPTEPRGSFAVAPMDFTGRSARTVSAGHRFALWRQV